MSNDQFQQFFREQYGSEWDGLFAKLEASPRQVARLNRFFSLDETLQKTYLMDPGSWLAADQLPVRTGDQVLDMCAAPGGKSLILAEKLFLSAVENDSSQALEAVESSESSDSELICNELSAARRERLKWVLQHYIPRAKRDAIFIQGKDGNLFGQKMPGHFDAVLLDAPCSGERHLLENKKEFKLWTPGRSKSMAQRQFSLLSSAWLCVRLGGHILYSTCSISPFENDGVVEKLKDRRAVEVLECSFANFEDSRLLESIEKTKYGYMVRPDRGEPGAGPIYFSLLRKLE